MFSGVPEQVGVVQQRGQLVDPLAHALFRPELSEQGDYLPHHQESVSVAGIMAGLGEGTANPGEHPFGKCREKRDRMGWGAWLKSSSHSLPRQKVIQQLSKLLERFDIWYMATVGQSVKSGSQKLGQLARSFYRNDITLAMQHQRRHVELRE